ncbi:hypothetical protein [Empedobacter sp. UBA6745]|uniref:hypothetical protein n=1 Tax=Empedobacter sp. UBA6745 TaxID=1946447 RepID=UPI0025B8EB9C|nr:hypothetical protein [Empedobacter sp. UBA6745]
MLTKIVEIIKNNSSSIKIEDNVFFCDYLIDDIDFLENLHHIALIENSIIDNYQLSDNIVLEFSISSLLSKGFYISKQTYLQWNYYELPQKNVYIYEFNDYLDNVQQFKDKHSLIIDLINEIQNVAKYSYKEEEILNTIIVREDKSLFLHLLYSVEDIDSIDDSKLSLISNFIDILKSDITTDKRNIYLNQLIEFLSDKEELKRFSFLLQNFTDYIKNSSVTYNYYQRNFSYNKLKVELDSKALEFYQKLQGVINDSQTKLIAIPTALVFALSTLDYIEINSLKNYLIVVGLIIFCLFIQIFINNQKSAINFIEENITYYKNTHANNKNELEKSFSKVDKERAKQITRLKLIEILLWFVPILTFFVIVFINIRNVVFFEFLQMCLNKLKLF